MNRIEDWENVNEASEGSFNNPVPGGYVVSITRVEDVPEKEYLKIEFDIAEGQFKEFGVDTLERAGFWPLSMVKSYKQKAAPFFKGFITSVERSNAGYKWNWEEKTLIGKRLAVVLGEEEYVKKNGGVGTKLTVSEVMSIEAMKKGGFKIPEKKLLAGSVPATKAVDAIADEDLPL